MENKNSSLKIILLTLGGVLTASIIFFLGFFFGQKSSLSQSEKVTNNQTTAPENIPIPLLPSPPPPLSTFPPTTSPPSPISSPPSVVDETKSWQTYTNAKWKYSVKYPSDWEIDDLLSNSLLTNKQSTVFRPTNAASSLYNSVSSASIAVIKPEKFAGLEKISQNPNAIIENTPATRIINKVSEMGIYNETMWIKKGEEWYTIAIAGYDNYDNKETKHIFDQILSTFKLLD